MQKLTNAYDINGYEYGIFYNEGRCELWDCFDYLHDGKPLATGSFEYCHNTLKSILEHALECRF